MQYLLRLLKLIGEKNCDTLDNFKYIGIISP
jgi:hypothetical protein